MLMTKMRSSSPLGPKLTSGPDLSLGGSKCVALNAILSIVHSRRGHFFVEERCVVVSFLMLNDM